MSEKPVESYRTAFLMIKEADDSWRVTTDLTVPFDVEAIATRQDIRIGCQEIARVIDQQDQAALAVQLLRENLSTDAPQAD